MTQRALTLADELALAAVRDEPGRLRVDSISVQAGLAGAILADLWLAGRINLVDNTLIVIDATPLGEPIIDGVLARMAQGGKPRRAQSWVRRLGTLTLRRQVFARLAAQGLVDIEISKVLGIFSSTHYGALDRLLAERTKSTVGLALAGGPCNRRTAALISLLNATRLLKKLVPEVDRVVIRELDRSQWIGKVVRRTIDNSRSG